AENRGPQFGGWLAATSLAPAFGIFGVVVIEDGKSRARYSAGAGLIMLLALTLALIGCSGATNLAGSAANAKSSQTATGQYSITVTATSGSLQHSVPVVLTVQ